MRDFVVGDVVVRKHPGTFNHPTGMLLVVDRVNPAGDLFFELDARPHSKHLYDLVPKTVTSSESDPSGISLNTPGAKADAGKARPSLVLSDMAKALSAVIKVANDGAAKYSPQGWYKVPDAFARYEDAGLRHFVQRVNGEVIDRDSGSLHLAHEAWNALAKLELYLRGNAE